MHGDGVFLMYANIYCIRIINHLVFLCEGEADTPINILEYKCTQVILNYGE